MASEFDNDDEARPARGDVTRRGFLSRSATMGAVSVGGAFAAGREAEGALGRPPRGGELIELSFSLNGQTQQLALDPRTTLLDLLREDLGLTGTKVGCNHGQCGACTVLVDGKRMNACLRLAATLEGAEVTTIEGIAGGDELHPMQQAFIEEDGFQCGYCTPGQIVSAIGCVREGHARNEAEIREYMSGNLCRCGAYAGIVKAVISARGATGEKA